MRRLHLGGASVAAVLLAAHVAVCETIVLEPSKDNTLYESDTGDLSNGSGAYFFAGRVAGFGGGAKRRGLIAFDVAGSIPAGATINSVTLQLHVSLTAFLPPETNVTLHRVVRDWGEGISDSNFMGGGQGAIPSTGDATWIHTLFDTDFWTNPGGDFSVTASAGQSVGGIDFYSWGSTAAMVADVQAWLDDPSTNFGWLIRGDENIIQTAKRFDSRENLIPDNRPKLTIDFTRAGDCNADDIVDLLDYRDFFDCARGTGTDCDCFDFNGNGNIDLGDFGALQATFPG